MALNLQLDQVQIGPGLRYHKHLGLMRLNESQCVIRGRLSSAISGTKQGRQLTQAQAGGHKAGANALSQTRCSLPGFCYCPAKYRERSTGHSSWEPEEARKRWRRTEESSDDLWVGEEESRLLGYPEWTPNTARRVQILPCYFHF